MNDVVHLYHSKNATIRPRAWNSVRETRQINSNHKNNQSNRILFNVFFIVAGLVVVAICWSVRFFEFYISWIWIWIDIRRTREHGYFDDDDVCIVCCVLCKLCIAKILTLARTVTFSHIFSFSTLRSACHFFSVSRSTTKSEFIVYDCTIHHYSHLEEFLKMCICRNVKSNKNGKL